QFGRGAGVRELAGVVVPGFRAAMQARDERRDRETFDGAEAAEVLRFEQCVVARLGVLARFGPVVARLVQGGARRNAGQCVDQISHATCLAPVSVLGVQPRAGATLSANSSI